MTEYYNLRNIRILLVEGFVIDELRDLCFDEPRLRPVYENLSDATTKSELVRSIVDYAHRKLVIESVLDWAKQHNLSRFEEHQPYYSPEAPGVNPSATKVGTVLPDNDLGKGITLGGLYRDIPLRIVATEWVQYGASLARSGWLFIPQWTESHAIAFFKIHVLDDRKGYIHIVDVSDPTHIIFLATGTGFRMEKEFHYAAHPTDVWDFVW